MNLKFAVLAALTAGFLPVAVVAQTSPATSKPETTAGSAETRPAPVPPTAYPAKIALIEFEQAVIATNEGQRTLAEVQKKYEPKKAQLDQLAAEIDSLKKQLQAAPATLSDEERASRLKNIDTKDKQYQRDAEDASTAYNQDVQEALGKVSQKVYVVMQKYVKDNGYTLLLNVGGQDSPIMWTSQNPNADISEAVIQAYNASSGVAAPPPPAPSPSSSTRPKSTTTPPPTTKPQ
jgi:Skp family chaperone for outer membrane proteins